MQPMDTRPVALGVLRATTVLLSVLGSTLALQQQDPSAWHGVALLGTARTPARLIGFWDKLLNLLQFVEEASGGWSGLCHTHGWKLPCLKPCLIGS